ncbi:MAG: HlyC/CorC family transporter [Bacteriovoracaceae bacterium]|nr:HlyC/CorC family transporter [Bacteriovoracaceae bacterium]
MIGPYEIVGLTLCFLASGFFSGSEAVLMSIGVDRAKQLIEAGGAKGRAMSFMTERPTEMLTTILIGNNLANVMAASLTTTITARYYGSEVVGISVGITTIVILVFGEIIPKTVARSHAEKLSVFTIRVLQMCYYISFPISKTLSLILEKVLGENAQIRGNVIRKRDIEYMVNKAEKEKTMDSKQLDLLTSILEFPTIKVKDIMVPRSRVQSIPKEATYQQTIDIIRVDNYSRYPIYAESIDDTLGFLHVKDLSFIGQKMKDDFKLTEFLKPPFFVYEHMKIQAVFDYMNRKKVHLALVKDENGLVVGIITLEDIIEEIMGDIQDEHDPDEDNMPEIHEGEELGMGILIDGSITIRDLYTEFDINIPLNNNFSTLAGFFLDTLGNTFPERGQIIVWEGLTFELTRVENSEIKEILIKEITRDRREDQDDKDRDNERDDHEEDKDGNLNS